MKSDLPESGRQSLLRTLSTSSPQGNCLPLNIRSRDPRWALSNRRTVFGLMATGKAGQVSFSYSIPSSSRTFFFGSSRLCITGLARDRRRWHLARNGLGEVIADVRKSEQFLTINHNATRGLSPWYWRSRLRVGYTSAALLAPPCFSLRRRVCRYTKVAGMTCSRPEKLVVDHFGALTWGSCVSCGDGG